MAPPSKSIQRRLLMAMLLTSFAVLVLTCASFVVYEVVTFRKETVRHLSIRAQVLAANSTASLAFQNTADAVEVLSALSADPDITAAALYDKDGRLFAKFPTNLPEAALPAAPESGEPRFADSHLIIFTPVVQNDKRLGTFYLKSSLRAMDDRLGLYGIIVLLVMGGSFLLAWAISAKLLRHISKPILALAESVRSVSETEDYSVRAQKFIDDELGQLADGFNTMLARVQTRDAALRESEQRLRELADAMPQIVWTARPDGSLDYYNQRWFDYTGRTLEETQGWGWKPVLHPNDAQRYASLWTESISTGSPFHIECRFKRALDWAYRWHLGRALPVRGKDGRIVRWFGSCTDIDDQKRAATEIEILNAELEKRVLERTTQLAAANKELEAFSYSVSHDLRAPLRHIDGYVQLLAEKAGSLLGEKNGRYLKIIAECAKEMGQLIDDLLLFSRMGRAELRQTDVDLKQLCDETIQSLQPDTRGRNVRWVVGELPVARADCAMLRSVFANLLGNAVKYTRRRDPAEIEIGRGNGKPDEIVVFVRDNGAGFDMKYVDKLFGVFQRLHASEDFEGTGIGLANVNRIITRHGGRCWADGKVDAGATFYFSLPKTAPS